MITRTPLRVSLFGGGTDYPEYFERKPGAVIGLAIDKYIFISGLTLDGHQSYNYRVSYSSLEYAESSSEIRHPVVREVLSRSELKERLDISVMSDLPASGSGLGSSSAFTVGFVHLVNSLSRRTCTKIDLARQAISIERDVLKENVGIQDQLHASFGGINRFDFHGTKISITPLQIPSTTMRDLSESMVLVHTGTARRATDVVEEQVVATRENRLDNDLKSLFELVSECVDLLEGGKSDALREVGRRLSESWMIKRQLSGRVTTSEIDELYRRVMAAGAFGAKLCGAGGGGYILALVPRDLRPSFSAAVSPASTTVIRPDTTGSTLVYPNNVETTWP